MAAATALTAFREAELADLRWHWGEAYSIAWNRGADTWQAVRRDGRSVLSAPAAQALRERIRSDYQGWSARRRRDIGAN